VRDAIAITWDATVRIGDQRSRFGREKAPVPLPPRDFTEIGPKEGERLPEILLPDQSGAAVDLHALRGARKALVVFYRSADW